MKLFELFTTNFDVNKADDVHDSEKFLKIKTMIGKRQIEFLAMRTGGLWDVEFSEIEVSEDGTEYNNYRKTNSGSAPQVLSFVVSCIKHLIKKRDPKFITFSASKSDRSRASVYERMIKREFPEYKYEKIELDRGIKFDLTKKE